MTATPMVFRMTASWILVHDAIFEATSIADIPVLVRQRSSGRLRVREQRRWSPPVRLDIEILPESSTTTVVTMFDETGWPGRTLPWVVARRRRLMGQVQQHIEAWLERHAAQRTDQVLEQEISLLPRASSPRIGFRRRTQAEVIVPSGFPGAHDSGFASAADG